MAILLSEHLAKASRRNGQGEALNVVIKTIATATKRIGCDVRRGGIETRLRGQTGAHNVHGEEVQKLDLWANTIMIE